LLRLEPAQVPRITDVIALLAFQFGFHAGRRYSHKATGTDRVEGAIVIPAMNEFGHVRRHVLFLTQAQGAFFLPCWGLLVSISKIRAIAARTERVLKTAKGIISVHV
jgi:hypothetical protein